MEVVGARSRALKQLAVSYLVVNALVFALSQGPARRYSLHEFIGALFLFGALRSVRADDDDTARYGIDLAGIFPGAAGDGRSLVRAVWEGIPKALRELAIAAAVMAVVFPVYMYFWPRFNLVPRSRHFGMDAAHVREVLTNLLAVALPEEMYFRGYVQTRMHDALGWAPSDARFGAKLRAAIGPVLVTSVLFAITHLVVARTPARAAVFFPSLLFCALREWRGGIGAAVFVHAGSNVFELWLEGH